MPFYPAALAQRTQRLKELRRVEDCRIDPPHTARDGLRTLWLTKTPSAALRSFVHGADAPRPTLAVASGCGESRHARRAEAVACTTKCQWTRTGSTFGG